MLSKHNRFPTNYTAKSLTDSANLQVNGSGFFPLTVKGGEGNENYFAQNIHCGERVEVFLPDVLVVVSSASSDALHQKCPSIMFNYNLT